MEKDEEVKQEDRRFRVRPGKGRGRLEVRTIMFYLGLVFPC